MSPQVNRSLRAPLAASQLIFMPGGTATAAVATVAQQQPQQQQQQQEVPPISNAQSDNDQVVTTSCCEKHFLFFSQQLSLQLRFCTDNIVSNCLPYFLSPSTYSLRCRTWLSTVSPLPEWPQ